MAREVNWTEAAEKFIDKGRVQISFVWTDLVPQIINDFRRDFLSLPDDEKRRFTIPVPDPKDPEGEPDNGYLRRDGEKKSMGGKWDRKSMWHYRPWHWDWFAKAGIELTPHEHWLYPTHMLYLRYLHGLMNFARAFDKVMPGYDLTSRTRQMDALHQNVIRHIVYDPPLPGEMEVAQPHKDKNGITFHIAESRPGLRIGEEGKMELYVVVPDTVLIFPGRQMESITKGKIKALLHGVWEKNPEADQRSSTIFFGHL